MLKSAVLKYYSGKPPTNLGAGRKVARVLGISVQSVHAWGEVVPERMAARLDRATSGRLVYDPADYMEAAS